MGAAVATRSCAEKTFSATLSFPLEMAVNTYPSKAAYALIEYRQHLLPEEEDRLTPEECLEVWKAVVSANVRYIYARHRDAWMTPNALEVHYVKLLGADSPFPVAAFRANTVRQAMPRLRDLGVVLWETIGPTDSLLRPAPLEGDSVTAMDFAKGQVLARLLTTPPPPGYVAMSTEHRAWAEAKVEAAAADGTLTLKRPSRRIEQRKFHQKLSASETVNAAVSTGATARQAIVTASAPSAVIVLPETPSDRPPPAYYPSYEAMPPMRQPDTSYIAWGPMSCGWVDTTDTTASRTVSPPFITVTVPSAATAVPSRTVSTPFVAVAAPVVAEKPIVTQGSLPVETVEAPLPASHRPTQTVTAPSAAVPSPSQTVSPPFATAAATAATTKSTVPEGKRPAETPGAPSPQRAASPQPTVEYLRDRAAGRGHPTRHISPPKISFGGRDVRYYPRTAGVSDAPTLTRNTSQSRRPGSERKTAASTPRNRSGLGRATTLECQQRQRETTLAAAAPRKDEDDIYVAKHYELSPGQQAADREFGRFVCELGGWRADAAAGIPQENASPQLAKASAAQRRGLSPPRSKARLPTLKVRDAPRRASEIEEERRRGPLTEQELLQPGPALDVECETAVPTTSAATVIVSAPTGNTTVGDRVDTTPITVTAASTLPSTPVTLYAVMDKTTAPLGDARVAIVTPYAPQQTAVASPRPSSPGGLTQPAQDRVNRLTVAAALQERTTVASATSTNGDDMVFKEPLGEVTLAACSLRPGAFFDAGDGDAGSTEGRPETHDAMGMAEASVGALASPDDGKCTVPACVGNNAESGGDRHFSSSSGSPRSMATRKAYRTRKSSRTGDEAEDSSVGPTSSEESGSETVTCRRRRPRKQARSPPLHDSLEPAFSDEAASALSLAAFSPRPDGVLAGGHTDGEVSDVVMGDHSDSLDTVVPPSQPSPQEC